MTKDEALLMCLEYIEKNAHERKYVRHAIKAALKTKDEPLEYWNAVEGWVKIDEVREHFDLVGCGTIYKTAGEGREPLYITPPQRTWAGLTNEEIEYAFTTNSLMVDNGSAYMVAGLRAVNIAKAIEAKLKEKNT